MKDSYSKLPKLIPSIIILLFILGLFRELFLDFQSILAPTIIAGITIVVLLQFKEEHRVIKTIIGIIIFLYIVWFLSLIKTILIPFAIAVVLAYVLDPAVKFLQKKGISRSTAALLLIGVLIFAFILSILFVIPVMGKEISAFIDQLPLMRDKVQDWFNNLQDSKEFGWVKDLWEYEVPPYIEEAIDNLLADVQESLSKFSQESVDYVTEAFSSVMHFIIGALELFIIPVFVFYILEETSEIKKFIISFFPPKKREYIFSITNDINETLSTFLRGQLFNCTVVGTVTAVSFLLIGIKFPFLIGVITAIMNFIPYIGNIIGPSPALILALFTPNPLVSFILVLITIACLHLLDSYYLYPKVHGKTLRLSPLMIMMAVIIGGMLYGAPGMFLAIPTICVLKVLFARWVKRYKVEEEEKEEEKKEEDRNYKTEKVEEKVKEKVEKEKEIKEK